VEELLQCLIWIAVGAPFLGSLLAGLPGKHCPRWLAQSITTGSVAIALFASIIIAYYVFVLGALAVDKNLYVWAQVGHIKFCIGLLLDHLTAVMMLVVTFVSFLVHVYSIGYMEDDPGANRFFAYMSLFTFAMLLLVTANNFLQLFIGWEGVGLVSYLLIGFWFSKNSAVEGSLKAFIVNRVGDFGFILAIAALLDYTGTLHYAPIFSQAQQLAYTHLAGYGWSLDTVICLLLFIGAMGKSAQLPLHIWLPESMEGPTPISALIHAATMVTAGVFMVARMSPLFEFSTVALSTTLIFGASTALFLGCVAIVQQDIKRVIAYSTISQLGYMMAANGVSAYAAGIFHLMTHACFKALLFLAAGSVIIAMHHKQNLRDMGGLRKAMPITYICFLIGALALSAIPPFAGFYSKDAIIEAVHMAHIPGAHYAYVCLVLGGFVTALYIFRAFFLTFHGAPCHEVRSGQVKESRFVVTFPLVMLAIPSVILGALLVYPMLYANPNILGHSIVVHPNHNVLAQMNVYFISAWHTFLHAFVTVPFWFAFSGVIIAWLCYAKPRPWPAKIAQASGFIYKILVDKYGFDRLYGYVFVRGSQKLSRGLYHKADLMFIDHYCVNGAGRSFARLSTLLRRMQSGQLAQYILVMILGLLALLWWLVIG